MSHYSRGGSGHVKEEDAPGRLPSGPLKPASTSDSFEREALLPHSAIALGRQRFPTPDPDSPFHKENLIEGFSPLPGLHLQPPPAYKPSAPYIPPGHAAYRGSFSKLPDGNLAGGSHQQPYIPPPQRTSHVASPLRGGAACSPSDRFNSLATGIMSENVQQRFLFSKKPNYGPLATPIATRPPDPIRPHTANAASTGGAGETWRYHAGARGRVMPKLGQGDARHGRGCELTLFDDSGGDRVRQRSEASESREIADNNNWGDTAAVSLSLPPPPPLSFSPNSVHSFKSPKTPHEDSGGYFPTENSLDENLFRAEKLHRRPHGFPESDINTTSMANTTPNKNTSFTSIFGTASTSAPRASAMATHGGKSILNPAAAEFVRASTQHCLHPYHPSHHLSNHLQTVRARPMHWDTQCRWTAPPHGASVMDCRYGDHCNYGHNGDGYFDAPGVRYGFADGGVYQTLPNITTTTTTTTTITTEKEGGGVYDFEMVGRDGYLPAAQQLSDGNDNGPIRAPDFSWTKVGCFGNMPVGDGFRKEHPIAEFTHQAGGGNEDAEEGGDGEGGNGDSESTFFTATEH